MLNETQNYNTSEHRHFCCGEHNTPASVRETLPDGATAMRATFEKWHLMSVQAVTNVIANDIEEQNTQKLEDLLTEHTWLTEEIMDAEDRGKDASNDRLERRLIGEQIEALRQEMN